MHIDSTRMDRIPLSWDAICQRVHSVKPEDWKIPRNDLLVNYEGGSAVTVNLCAQFKEGDRRIEYAFTFDRDLLTGAKTPTRLTMLFHDGGHRGCERVFRGPDVEVLYALLIKRLRINPVPEALAPALLAMAEAELRERIPE